MLQVNVTVSAPELAEAMSALALALNGAKIEGIAPTKPKAEPLPPVDYAPPVQNPTPAPPAVLPVAAPVVSPPAPAPAPVAPPPAPVPTPPPAVPVAQAPTYTRDQIMTAGAALIDAGKINELMGLLNTFGVQAVTQLKADQLGTFATELRKLGAQI